MGWMGRRDRSDRQTFMSKAVRMGSQRAATGRAAQAASESSTSDSITSDSATSDSTTPDGPTSDNPTSASITSEIVSGFGRSRRSRSERGKAVRLKKTRASVNTSGLRFHRTACRGRSLGNCEVIPRNERRALELFCPTGSLAGTMAGPSRLMSRRHPLSSTGAAGSNSFLRTDQPGGSCDDAGIKCRQFHKA